ncbi:MAG: hypothetical protein ACRDOD_06965 [Streptosporangiaceae bacterium]
MSYEVSVAVQPRRPIARGQDHAGPGIDQAGEHEALDVRQGVEQRFGLIEKHRCFLPRGGQA